MINYLPSEPNRFEQPMLTNKDKINNQTNMFNHKTQNKINQTTTTEHIFKQLFLSLMNEPLPRGVGTVKPELLALVVDQFC